jgi:hypothetical protein
MTAPWWLIGLAIVAIAVTAMFLIAEDVWRPYRAGMHRAVGYIKPTEDEWPTDEYRQVQSRAQRLDAAAREQSVDFASRPHVECVDSWADGLRPCGRCEPILGVRT